MEHEHAATMRRARAARDDAVQLDLVAVAHRPALNARFNWRGPTHELSPERLQMRARYPPRWGVGILAGATHVTGTGSKLGTGDRSIISSLHEWTFRFSE